MWASAVESLPPEGFLFVRSREGWWNRRRWGEKRREEKEEKERRFREKETLTGGADSDPLPALEHAVLHDGSVHLALEGGVEALLAELGK